MAHQEAYIQFCASGSGGSEVNKFQFLNQQAATICSALKVLIDHQAFNNAKKNIGQNRT